MTRSTPTPDRSDGQMDPQFTDDLRELGEAIDDLAGETSYITRALTENLRAMRPVSREGRLTKQQEQFLIQSGTFTADELEATKREVDRGSLQLGAAEAFLSNLCATMSLDDVTGYLNLDEEAVRTAVSEGRLYAIEISGRLRFPAWQFNVGSPEKLIPGLADVISVVTPRWDWQSVAGFMATPQSDLFAEGRQTPVEWLRDGGDVNDIREIVESDDWW
ncbi:hypothetical protein [Leifsonia sp. NPDC058248]|uniref:hypothetical protein n=1 Tax=Leifsonia sp. NPDC058248 TaxID=3346402 RepID=UPI0036D94FBC